jgi:excisionase family DNA binding protein
VSGSAERNGETIFPEGGVGMPRTKTLGSTKTNQPASPNNVDRPFGEILTLAEAAAYLRLSESQVLRLIDEQALPARRLGTEPRFLKSAIQQWLSAGTPIQPGKTAQLAVAGSWKDDPLVEAELRQAHRHRGRSRTEEGA